MAEKMMILYLGSSTTDVGNIERILEAGNQDFEIQKVDSKEKFSTAIRIQHPELIIAGNNELAFNAELALEELQASGLKIPFIVVSDNPSVEAAVNLLKKGADDYLSKKNLEQLPSVISAVLEKFRKEKDAEAHFTQLSSEEIKFRRLVEYGVDPMVVFTPGGSTSYISPAAEKVLGYSIEDLKNINVKSIIHPEDKSAASGYLALCLENPGVSIGSITGRVKHKDGTWRWMQASFINLLYDEDVKGIVNNFKEVTAQKKAELAIKESEAKYHAFFENSMDAILLTEDEGRIFAANPTASRIFGMTEEEICKVGRAGIADASDPRLAKGIKERQDTGKSRFETTMVRKGGEKFPGEITTSIFIDAEGNSKNSIIVRDLSENKQAEEELKVSRENYKMLFDYSPLPNWVYDEKTYDILDVNQAAIDHYGYSREEFLQLNLKDLRPEEEILKLIEDISSLHQRNENVRKGEFIHKKKDGSRITVEIYGYGLQFQGSRCRHVVSTDITEKEAFLQKLQEKSERLQAAEKFAKIGYWEVGFENNYFYWSDGVYDVWGREREAFQVGEEEFLKTIHPDDLAQFKTKQQLALTGEKALDFEHRIILPDGSIKWIHEKGKLVKDEQGKPLRFEGSIQDITERKLSTHKLLMSEARHRTILKSQTNYLVRVDLNGKYSYVNDKFYNDFSWIFPDKNIEGEWATSSVKEYDHEKIVKAFNQCLENPNHVYQVEMDKLQKDGKGRTTLWDLVCLTDALGNPVEVQGVGIDITDRVEAEQSLKESNTRYELVSKATSDAIYDWDIKTDYFFWGEAFYTLFGYSRSEFLTTIDSWLKKVHPEDSLFIQDSLTRTIEGTENRWEVEYRFKKADGKYSNVIEKGFILRDENGKAFRMVGAIQDITEKKKLEELLDEASRFARIGSFEFDFEQDSLYWSPVTKEIHEVDEGFEPNLETGMLFYKEGESRDRMSREFARAVEENIPYDLELQMITAKGNEVWVRKIGRPTFVDGKCVRINGSFQDIDKIKRAELEAVKASEEKEKILESIGDAFFAVDRNWTVNYFNKHVEELLDFPKKEILGENFWSVFSDAVETHFFTYCQKAMQEQAVQHFEEYFDRVDRWFDVSVYPSLCGLSVYFRDITDRKISELKILELNKNLKVHTEELVTANKGLEQFSFIVSHNLRSPLANILGLAELINQEDYPQEIKENFLKELLNNVKRLDHVIIDLNDILKVKVEAETKKEPVVLEKLVENIQVSIQNLVEKEQAEIITDFEVAQLNTVQSYLHSIFYNLLVNSIKYRQSHINPVIRISSEKKESGVIIRFKDNGLGIDLVKKGDQVFGLYKRFHNHVEGKGMGLFMVKTQVEMLGGKISIESERNKGTEFILEFKEGVLNLTHEDEEAPSLYRS